VKLRELFEVKAGKVGKRYQEPTRGLNTFGDAEKANSDYTQYRLGLALACSDGVNPIDIDPKTWHGKRKTAHPYTEEEQAMLNQSYKIVGASHKDLNKGDMRSRELDTTNIVSPVAKPKRNKYGV
jgi:hypothetical protein